MVAWFSQRYTMGENNFSSLLDRKKIGRNWAYRSKQSTKTIFSAKYGSKNFEQHKAFLDEVIGTPMHKEIIEWFLTLPLWLELDGIRAVHACWHKPFMEYLAPKLADGNRLTRELMGEACREPANEQEKDSPEPSIFKAVEALTKGIEIPLPDPHRFVDKDGHSRRRVRTRWWDRDANSYWKSAMLDDVAREALPEDQIPDHVRIGHDGGAPVFIGHYWLTGTPRLLTDTVACLDYSIAKGGQLVAYRWEGEPLLDSSKFFWVGK